MSTAVIRSIDVGYGNTKFCFGKSETNALKCRHFPSIASVSSGIDKGAGVMAKRDLIEVFVENNRFLVGKDSLDTLSARDDKERTLLNNYIDTPQYLALFRGALYYLAELNIDLLVTGLPVNHFARDKDRLSEKLKGKHVYPDGRIIFVNDSWVIPQPIGGFINWYMNNSNNEYGKLDNLRSLTIDVGYYTVDWLVCRGMKLQDERSGSTPGGMSLFLKKLTELIADEKGNNFSDINLVDMGIINNCKTRIAGEVFDFSHLMKSVSVYIRNAIQSILVSVGTLDDIDAIILVGGGAECFRPVLEEMLKGRKVIMPDESIYANAKGFYLAGDSRVKSYGK